MPQASCITRNQRKWVYTELGRPNRTRKLPCWPSRPGPSPSSTMRRGSLSIVHRDRHASPTQDRFLELLHESGGRSPDPVSGSHRSITGILGAPPLPLQLPYACIANAPSSRRRPESPLHIFIVGFIVGIATCCKHVSNFGWLLTAMNDGRCHETRIPIGRWRNSAQPTWATRGEAVGWSSWPVGWSRVRSAPFRKR